MWTEVINFVAFCWPDDWYVRLYTIAYLQFAFVCCKCERNLSPDKLGVFWLTIGRSSLLTWKKLNRNLWHFLDTVYKANNFMLITSFDANMEVLNVSSEIIIVTWIISSSTVLAGYLKKPKGSAFYMLPVIAIMNWHAFLFSESIVL